MGGGGKGSEPEQQSQNSLVQVTPWGPVQDELQDLYDTAQHTEAQQPYPYPGVVPYSPTTVAAMEATTNRALAGNPLLPMAQQGAATTMGGGYLSPETNPLFQRAFQASYRDIVPEVDAQAVASGRYGGGLTQMNKIEALGDAWAQPWMQQYGAERDRMLKTQAMSPALAQADYYDIDRLAGVGAQQETKAQEALTDAMNRWSFQQQAPFDLQQHQAGIYSTASPYSTQQSTGSSQATPAMSGSNPLGAALGGAGTGFAMGGPWGAAAGAGLGLLSAMK